MPRVLTLAMVALALLLATPHGGTQAQDQIEVKIRWIKYINPTGGRDVAYGVCAFGDYIAVVGGASGRPYVALLRKGDGSVVKEWIGSEKGMFSSCISVGGKLYAVGATFINYKSYGVIYAFDENLNILARVRSESPSFYYSLAYNDGALYLGGGAYEDVNGDGKEEHVGLVEKRALDESLRLVNSKKIYFDSWREGWIYDIGVEPSTSRIWAVGYYYGPNVTLYGSVIIPIHHSLIVIFDSDLRELKRIEYPGVSEGYLGELTGIAFDGRQYAYVSGYFGVAKFSVDGELVAINKDGKARYKIVYSYNYLYTFGKEDIRGYWRHVLYIHDANLNIVKRYVLSENVGASSLFKVGMPVLEGNNIYVAGYDEALGRFKSRVVVYSLSIEGVTVATAPGTEGATAIIIVSDGALTQLIAAGLASIGVVLAIALLLLRRR